MGFYSDTIFPYILDATEPPQLGEIRQRFVEDVHGDILEIGFGTGGQLSYYPAHVNHLYAVEPSGGMQRRANRRIANWHGAVQSEVLEGDKLPFKDQQFDTVVISMVLCSATNPEVVLKETHRVLKVGGKFHFLEHVISDDPKTRRWQKRLDRTHQHIACGCSLTRNTLKTIETSYFDIQKCSGPVTLPGVSQAIYPYIYGEAIRRDYPKQDVNR